MKAQKWTDKLVSCDAHKGQNWDKSVLLGHSEGGTLGLRSAISSIPTIVAFPAAIVAWTTGSSTKSPDPALQLRSSHEANQYCNHVKSLDLMMHTPLMNSDIDQSFFDRNTLHQSIFKGGFHTFTSMLKTSCKLVVSGTSETVPLPKHPWRCMSRCCMTQTATTCFAVSEPPAKTNNQSNAGDDRCMVLPAGLEKTWTLCNIANWFRKAIGNKCQEIVGYVLSGFSRGCKYNPPHWWATKQLVHFLPGRKDMFQRFSKPAVDLSLHIYRFENSHCSVITNEYWRIDCSHMLSCPTI